MLWHGLSSSGSTLSKHRWKIVLLSIDLHRAAGFAKVNLEKVWVNDLFNFLSFLIHKVICCHKVSLLEDVLSLAMAKHDVTLNTSLWMLVSCNIVSIFSLCLDHLLGLSLIVICRS